MKSRINKKKYKFKFYNNQVLVWFKNDVPHREKNLPAKIWPDGDMEWWWNGKCTSTKYLNEN